MSFIDTLQRRSVKSQETKALKQVSVYDIIQEPIITEKTYKQVPTEWTNEKDKNYVYCFKVASNANKNDIKVAIHTIYKVDIASVRTLRVVQKGRSQRKLVRRSYKKAMVTLTKWQKIDLI